MIDNSSRIQELKEEANWFWTDEIIGSQQENLLISQLIESTEAVQTCVKESNIENITENLMNLKDEEENEIPRFIVLKNLMILLDVSAEILDRAVMYLYEKKIVQLTVGENVYKFFKLGSEFKIQLSNNNIYKQSDKDDEFFHDILNLLLYASGSEELKLFNTFESFKLGLLTGNEELLTKFLLQRSIENSSQIKQLRAVSYGNGLQREVMTRLTRELSNLGVKVALDNRYLGIQQFDIVLYKENEDEDIVLPTALTMFGKKTLTNDEKEKLKNTRASLMKNWKWAVIEVSFQETTNSTMERKSKQAANGLYRSIQENNHQLIYLIDGAGYFRRPKVIDTILNNSHQVASLSTEGQEKILEYLKKYFE